MNISLTENMVRSAFAYEEAVAEVMDRRFGHHRALGKRHMYAVRYLAYRAIKQGLVAANCHVEFSPDTFIYRNPKTLSVLTKGGHPVYLEGLLADPGAGVAFYSQTEKKQKGQFYTRVAGIAFFVVVRMNFQDLETKVGPEAELAGFLAGHDLRGRPPSYSEKSPVPFVKIPIQNLESFHALTRKLLTMDQDPEQVRLDAIRESQRQGR